MGYDHSNIEYAAFSTTSTGCWRDVARAGAGSDTSACREALERLLKKYYPVLKSYLVYVRRVPLPQAEDLLHDFISQKVLEQNILSSADPAKGKFRTFLLTVLTRFAINQHRHESAQKRQPAGFVNLDDVAYGLAEPGGDATHHFDRMWARQVMESALERMEEECRRTNRPELWELFQARVVQPSLYGQEPISYEEIVARFHLASPSAAYNFLLSAKRVYARHLMAVVAEYTCTREQAKEELASLQSVFVGLEPSFLTAGPQDSAGDVV